MPVIVCPQLCPQRCLSQAYNDRQSFTDIQLQAYNVPAKQELNFEKFSGSLHRPWEEVFGYFATAA